MKPVILFALTIAGIQCHTPGNHLNCSSFKNGIFILVSEDPLMKGEIIREGNRQVIKNSMKNTESFETIEWLSECKYKIKEREKPESGWLTVEIIKIVGDTAYIQASHPNIEYKPILKIVKIK